MLCLARITFHSKFICCFFTVVNVYYSSSSKYRYTGLYTEFYCLIVVVKSTCVCPIFQYSWLIATGNSVLVLTATDVDKTGASYYGEQNLYYLSVRGDGNMVSLGNMWPHPLIVIAFLRC